MICDSCKVVHHHRCYNIGSETNSWCDCQHRVDAQYSELKKKSETRGSHWASSWQV